jgi:hypothetical protein
MSWRITRMEFSSAIIVEHYVDLGSSRTYHKHMLGDFIHLKSRRESRPRL